MDAERSDAAFLVLRDTAGAQQIVTLDPVATPFTIGRSSDTDICVDWDRQVSRLHAELTCLNGVWTVSDDGLSRNGTFVGDQRIGGRRRLADGDQVRVGATRLTFRCPPVVAATRTSMPTQEGPEQPLPPKVSEAERRVAVALCRPFGGDREFASPATNEEIARELVLSVSVVKTHLRRLCQRFELDEFPQNVKRLRLVERLLGSGVVSEREL